MGVSIALCINLNMQSAPYTIILSNLLFGVGSATALVPISGVALEMLPKDQIANAAGIHSLTKCVTGSIATSLASSFSISLAQIHQTYLLKNMSIYNPNFAAHFNALKGAFLRHGEVVFAIKKANLALYNQLLAQSKLCAISDLFIIAATLTFLAIPLVLLLRTDKK